MTALCLSASAAGVLTTAPAASAAVTPSAIDLAGYSIVGRYPLPTQFDSEAPAGSELATEVSAITYDWDSDTLFVVGDEGTSVVQVSTTGELIDSMSLVGFEDTEGLSYVGGGQFVVAEERLRNAVLVTYAGGTVLDRADATAVKLGTTIGNIGLEGIGYDPLTTGPDGLGFIGVKESAPLGVFQTNIDFDAGTATNGGPGVENPVDLFDPTLVGTTDLSDVFPLSLLPDLDGGDSENLLIISQESGRIVNVDRNGVIDSQVDITDVGAPLTVHAQTMEGVTLDRDNVMYTT
ncbi:MAG: SdiA-regulated domain-containing protein, partial [Ilumatobacter sp.]